jgi:predicted HAD superfamily phosphohydrolase YqeG
MCVQIGDHVSTYVMAYHCVQNASVQIGPLSRRMNAHLARGAETDIHSFFGTITDRAK